jgi:uncharacterized protein YifE (UPF0438 family)
MATQSCWCLDHDSCLHKWRNYEKKVKTVMVNICRQYQQNNRKFKQWWSTYVTNINKTTESLNSDGQHMSPISTKQQKVKTGWSTYVTIINKTNNHFNNLNSLNIQKRPRHMPLAMQVLAWDGHTTVAVLYRLMKSRTSLSDSGISQQQYRCN